MKRKRMHPIVKVITWVLIAVFLISGCSLDSESWLPFITTLGSLAGLTIIARIYGVLA